jgi:hypothetical protein
MTAPVAAPPAVVLGSRDVPDPQPASARANTPTMILRKTIPAPEQKPLVSERLRAGQASRGQ